MIRWLLRCIARFDRNRPDAAWKASGVRYTTDTSYDYAKAKAGYLKAQKQSETGRKYAPAKAKTSTAPLVFTRKAGN